MKIIKKHVEFLDCNVDLFELQDKEYITLFSLTNLFLKYFKKINLVICRKKLIYELFSVSRKFHEFSILIVPNTEISKFLYKNNLTKLHKIQRIFLFHKLDFEILFQMIGLKFQNEIQISTEEKVLKKKITFPVFYDNDLYNFLFFK